MTDDSDTVVQLDDERTVEELYDRLDRAVARAGDDATEHVNGLAQREAELMADDSTRNVSFQISEALLDRIEQSREQFDAAATSPSGKVSRSEAMRRLILRGLETMENEEGTNG
jgi:hypothetical protein